MNIQKYLERINYNEEIKVNLATLKRLQKAHLQNIPFENLDIHYGVKINLDLEAIYNKIVLNKRGGFCYELNGLFYHLLKKLGFEVKMISGRVFTKEESYGQEYDHLAIITKLNHLNYLVDVGFGKFSFEPLLIQEGIEQKDKFGLFQFDHFDQDYLRVNEVVDGQFIPQYIFKPIACKFSAFEMMCHFHQTSKDSHFTQQKVISIITENGRITLNDNKLKIRKGKEVQEFEFKEKSKFEELLKEYFDITP